MAWVASHVVLALGALLYGLAILPMVLIFVLLRKLFIRGIAMSEST